jgi:gamma-glutamyltranspeptidase/glutathione hydrolase
VFFKDGKPLRQGELLVQKDLAETLERFASAGPDGFYGGETARRFAAAIQRAGGLIDEKDLAAYACKERKPLVGKYRGLEVVSMAPPSSGGIALLQMLKLLEPHDLRRAGSGPPRRSTS